MAQNMAFTESMNRKLPHINFNINQQNVWQLIKTGSMGQPCPLCACYRQQLDPSGSQK